MARLYFNLSNSFVGEMDTMIVINLVRNIEYLLQYYNFIHAIACITDIGIFSIAILTL